jgi:Fungalysin metallopeptidase (M36)
MIRLFTMSCEWQNHWLIITTILAFGTCPVTGCSQDNVSIQLLVYDEVSDEYSLDSAEVTTLDDVWTLDGEATRLIGGSKLELDYVNNQLKWDEAGHTVAFSAVKKDDVLIPEDYDSLAMASIYYNMELSMLFFEEIGIPGDALGELPTYYWSNLTITEYVDGKPEKTRMLDNAFYMYIEDNHRAFFIMPFNQFQWIPMPLNGGILTHEYTHAVFDALVMDNISLMTLSGANFLYAINEGSADFFAVARTGDPDFMSHSIPKGVYVVACNGFSREIVRDASVSWAYSNAMDLAARTSDNLSYCPYGLGEFWESLLYEMATEIDSDTQIQGTQKVAGWLLGAIVELGQTVQADFEIWHLLSLLIKQIENPSDREAACFVVEKRCAVYFAEVDGC